MEILKDRDLDLIKPLLQDNDLPVSDLHNQILFFVEKQDDKIIAVGGLESAGTDALIRSIAVDERYKGKGLGQSITRQLLNYASEHGIKDIYLLTTTAEHYFPKFGFKEIDRAQVPAPIKNSSQYKNVCPDSAIVMKLDTSQNT